MIRTPLSYKIRHYRQTELRIGRGRIFVRVLFVYDNRKPKDLSVVRFKEPARSFENSTRNESRPGENETDLEKG